MGITEGWRFQQASSSCVEHRRPKGAMSSSEESTEFVSLIEVCKEQLDLGAESHQRLEWVCAAGFFELFSSGHF